MFISALKLLMKFQTTSLTEEVSITPMFSQGGNSVPQILSGGGYVMDDTQYLQGEGPAYSGYQTDISNAMTLGFWLYSVNPGMAIHPVSGNAISVSMPLMDFNEVGAGDTSIIRITENTTAAGENNLTVSFNNDTYYASSEDYAPSMWHHFWITYDGAELLIYVDGLSHSLVGESGSLPATVSGSLLDLYINHNFSGYSYSAAKNYGYVSDIFLMDVVNTTAADMQRVINDGIDYLVDDDFVDLYMDKSSIYFNDPDTIVVTSSIDDMSYVYIGRNDGKILRGSPLMWETRRTLADDGESDLLELSSDEKKIGIDYVDGETWDIVNGFLELKNKSVRL